MFHCLSCWYAPYLGPSLVFSQFQILLSHLWEFRGKKRRKEEEIKREKLRRNKTRKKKIIKKIKNYFKNRKSFLLASNWPSHFCWSPLQQVGRFRDSLSLGFQFGLKALLVCTLPPAGASGVGKGPSAPLWECCTARWGGGQSGCCRRIPQIATECLFFTFSLKNSSCSTLPLCTRKGLSSRTAHLSY